MTGPEDIAPVLRRVSDHAANMNAGHARAAADERAETERRIAAVAVFPPGYDRRLRVVPTEVIPPDLAPACAPPPDDDEDGDWWDDDIEDDGPCCQSAQVLGRVIDDMRTAAEELETKDPGAREVGRWLRVRAQRAAIDTRNTP